MTLTDFDSIAAGNADEKKEETVAMRSMQTYRNEERLHIIMSMVSYIVSCLSERHISLVKYPITCCDK